MDNAELDRLLQEGIAAARAGDRERACERLLRVVELDEEVEAAWLWLSGVVDDREERQICLENVLALNPDNGAARAGLRYLAAQEASAAAQPAAPAAVPPVTPASQPGAATATPLFDPQPQPARPRLTPVDEPPDRSGEPADQQPEQPELTRPSGRDSLAVDIDPFACPYCGGSVGQEQDRCDHCRRLVTLRSRKRPAGMALGWLVLLFLLLAVSSWGEGYLVGQLVQIGRLPEWLTQTAVRYMVGSALFNPDGLPGELVRFAGTFIAINDLLAGLCLLAALGLALRFRAVYWASFLLMGILITGTGAGLLAHLVGWVPALFRVGLVLLALRLLVESAPAYEWETRAYDASVDPDLRNALDYYNRGVRYRDMGMWAKAAAHFKIGAQLDPGRAGYRVALANAYARLGYAAAALAEADRALAREPGDAELRAFREALAGHSQKALSSNKPGTTKDTKDIRTRRSDIEDLVTKDDEEKSR